MNKFAKTYILATAIFIGFVSYPHIDQAEAQSCNFANRCSTLGASGSGATQNATRTRALARLQIQVNQLNKHAEKCGYRVSYSNPTLRPFQKFNSGFRVVVNQAFCRK